ncbi:MAG: ParB/RepB/Spo0J family partition protein [Clostridia bacterium]|nr:ParB/RepB/Spo0J family partition protein [Clostridia bacterium]
MAQKRGLGRGIGALIGDTSLPLEGIGESAKPTVSRETIELPIIQIDNNPDQPRRNFDNESLNELASSIKLYGIIQPIVVRPTGNGRYMIVSGERRWRAAKIARLSTVPVVIRDVEDQTLLELALVENLQREDLNVIESAASMNILAEEYGLTQIQLAERLGKSRTAVANTLRLLKLEPEIQQYLRDEKMTEGQARPLIGLEPEKQIELAEQIITRNLNSRQVEELVSQLKKPSRRTVPRERQTNPDLVLIENLFRNTLGCKVRASGSSEKGSITLQYFSHDDLGRIYDVLSSLNIE